MLVQSNTPSASVWRFPRKNDLDPGNLGWKKCQFYEPALNKAGSFDKVRRSEMALDCECLEGRVWPSGARSEHIRDVKKKPGACIYSRVGIMCLSVPNEMPDLMIFARSARLPRYHSLLLNRHRSISEAMTGSDRWLTALVPIRGVDFGSLLYLGLVAIFRTNDNPAKFVGFVPRWPRMDECRASRRTSHNIFGLQIFFAASLQAIYVR